MEARAAAWLETIAEHIPEALVVLDRARTIRFANKAAAALAKAPSPAALIGRSSREILRGHRIFDERGGAIDAQALPSELAFAERKETRGMTISDVDPEGAHRWLSVSSFPLAAKEGRPVRFVAIYLRDISERKKRADKLRFLIESSKVLSITTDLTERLKEKARLLIPALADWATVNVVNADGTLTRLAAEHRDKRKIAALQRFAAMAAEYSAESVIHRVLKTGEAVLVEKIDEGSASSAAQDAEGRALFEILAPCSAMIVPITSGDGKVLGVLSLAYAESCRVYTPEDVEFMREYGHHLSVVIDNARLYGEIARRDRAKDAFLATLSHELRNPLAPIKSSLELLTLRHPELGGSGELSVIGHQFDHMEKLLGDLLDVSRFTLGKLELKRTPVDLARLVEASAALHGTSALELGLSLSCSVPDRPVCVAADAVRLEQVVNNLLNNAEKFTPIGGSISVSLSTEGDCAVLRVADTGIGIPRAELGTIFEQYFQGATRLPHHKSGLGMGLLLVREIVRLHGGEVEASSAGAGEGSAFTVRLPLTPQAAIQAKARSRGAEAPALRQRVIVIDDNKAAADSLAQLLRAAGFEAQSSYRGQDGIEEFSAHGADHVIVDIGMPDMDGYEVARRLRQRGALAHLVALSGYGMEEDKQKARDSGFDVHLTKPVGLSELRAALGS